jgi:hypothetical protein
MFQGGKVQNRDRKVTIEKKKGKKKCGSKIFLTAGSIHAKSTNAVRDQITDFHENLTTYW